MGCGQQSPAGAKAGGFWAGGLLLTLGRRVLESASAAGLVHGLGYAVFFSAGCSDSWLTFSRRASVFRAGALAADVSVPAVWAFSHVLEAAQAVRVLGIETATVCGSVALRDEGGHVCSFEHSEPNAHAERILPLVERALAEAGWQRAQLERVAVGIGPGSFTGLRVGIALAEGIAMALGVPLVGVSSLRALSRRVPAEISGARLPVLDARRGEVFLAAYDAQGVQLVAPCAVPAEGVADLMQQWGLQKGVMVGAFAARLGSGLRSYGGSKMGFPHAREVAELGSGAEPDSSPAVPHYVRGPNLIKPKLWPTPFGKKPFDKSR